jgi:hypothetical protein
VVCETLCNRKSDALGGACDERALGRQIEQFECHMTPYPAWSLVRCLDEGTSDIGGLLRTMAFGDIVMQAVRKGAT